MYACLNDAQKSEVEDFYFRVNKFGTKLNRPEMNRAQYSDTLQQNLVEKLSDDADFASLQLFTSTALNRLNDSDLIAELLTLQLLGNTDKKNQVDKKFYESDDFSEEKVRDLEERFRDINAFTRNAQTAASERPPSRQLHETIKNNLSVESHLRQGPLAGPCNCLPIIKLTLVTAQ